MRLQSDYMIINGIAILPVDAKPTELVRAGGDIATIFDDNLTTALINTHDLIGAILRIHFCLEEFIKIWCNKVTNTDDFFDLGKGKFITFDLKLALAKKLGLPEDIATIFKLINSIRNKFAHDINAIINLNEVNDIRYKIDSLKTYGSVKIPKCNTPHFKTIIGNKLISWNDDITTKDHMIILYLTLSIKLISIFKFELNNKGISFNYST